MNNESYNKPTSEEIERCCRRVHRDSSDTLLRRVLFVCQHSGIRGLGIFKRIYENESLIRCIYEAESRLSCFDNVHVFNFMKQSASLIGVFLHAVESILKLNATNTNDPYVFLCKIVYEEIHVVIRKIFYLCGMNGCTLINIQNMNRIMLKMVYNNVLLHTQYRFIESLIEDHELFFEDLLNALKDSFEENGKRCTNACGWAGHDLTRYLLINRSQTKSCY